MSRATGAGDVLALRRPVLARAPIVQLVDALCATTTTDVAPPISHGAGRLVLVSGGLGSGRTTALVEAVETCRAVGIDAHLLLADDPSSPGLLDVILAAPPGDPVLLAIDDADVHHRDLLARLATSADRLRLRRVLVLTVIRGDATDPDPLIANLAAVGERIVLEPFDDRDLAALLSASGAGRQQPDGRSHPSRLPALVPPVRAATGGIPRLVVAALEGLPDTTIEAALDDPTSRLRTAAGSLLAGLDDEVREVLATVALLEDACEPALLGDACDGDVPGALRRALTAGVLELDVSTDPRRGGATAPPRVKLRGEALRRAAQEHDPMARHAQHLRLARALIEAPGRDADTRLVLRHLRRAGEHAPRELLAEVARTAHEESRTLGDLDATVEALEVLWELSIDTPDRWRELGSELAAAALHAGRRDHAWLTARTVLRSFDALSDDELTPPRRQALVTVALAATTGHEYLTDGDAQTGERLLQRIVARLGEHLDSARLLCRAAELTSMRPHVARLLVEPSRASRGARSSDQPGQQDADAVAAALLAHAEQLIASEAPDDEGLRAALDVAWSRVHLHDTDAPERRVRLTRALPALAGFDRAWAGTRLALDAVAVGERAAAERALRAASSAIVEDAPLTTWRVASVRATLQHAVGAPDAAELVETAIDAGRRAGEPMVELVALVQRTAFRVELDVDDLSDAELHTPEQGDPHPLVTAGRLEIRARRASLRRLLTSDASRELDDPACILAEVRGMLDLFHAGGVNRGNLNLFLVLLARALHHVHSCRRAASASAIEMVATVADLLAPYEDRVPTDVLGTVCYGSTARHLANLRALQGRHDEATQLAAQAHARDAELGLDRLVLAGVIDAARRAELAGRAMTPAARAELLALAGDADNRGLMQLGREARLIAHPELTGVLTHAQLMLLADLATGQEFRDIAELRGYSPGTMRKMALPIYRALGVAGRDEAVALAREVGLLGPLAR